MTDDPTFAAEHDDLPGPTDPDQLAAAHEALAQARQRLAATPANVVIVNHVMGLYELAAIHLSAQPPALSEASLAIDALGAIVDTLGERLGEDAPTLREALANIRLAYVSLRRDPAPTASSDEPG